MRRRISQNAFWGVAIAAVAIIVPGVIFVRQPSLAEVLGWAGTVLSTFFGAALAFWFNSLRTANEREEAERVAGNLALMTLAAFRNWLVQYQNTYIKPIQDAQDPWFAMRAGELINAKLEIDKTSLAFLHARHSAVWRDIVLEETRFVLLKDTVAQRNALMRETVWPKLEAAGLPHGASVETERVEQILGPAATQHLKHVTGFITKACSDDIESLGTCIVSLRRVLVEIYPRWNFVEP